MSPVGCVSILGDQGQPHALHGLHANAAQNFHMTVPSTHQHHILQASRDTASALIASSIPLLTHLHFTCKARGKCHALVP